jgi:hypothetical protein
VQDSEDRHKEEFHMTGLVPEPDHSSQRTKGAEHRKEQE